MALWKYAHNARDHLSASGASIACVVVELLNEMSMDFTRRMHFYIGVVSEMDHTRYITAMVHDTREHAVYGSCGRVTVGTVPLRICFLEKQLSGFGPFFFIILDFCIYRFSKSL